MESNQLLEHWRGNFGDSYADRNAATPKFVTGLTRLWAPVLPEGVSSIVEVGANIGLNLRALRNLTTADFWAVEPNDKARERLVTDGVVAEDHALAGDLRRLPLEDGAIDLAFTCGVLIHVPDDHLVQACRELHRVSRRWIVVQEYFATNPEMVPYHGHDNMLWRRDYGGLLLDLFDDLEPVSQGFFWRRTTVQDDLTWWLFRKARTEGE